MSRYFSPDAERLGKPEHENIVERMKVVHRSAQGVSLREAAGTIFALSAILPLLLFFLLWHYQLIARLEARVGLLLALLVAILGFVLFLRMVDRVSKHRGACRPIPPTWREADPRG